MTEFNRSNFKGASLNTIKEEQQRAEKALPKTNNFGSRPGFHTVEDGKNWRRIAPAHSPNEPAYRAKSTIFLECEVPEVDDDGKETGKKEVKRKNIFVATQHSLKVKEDPCLLYIAFVQKRANDEIQDKEERQKFLYPINGWRSRDGKWNWGIKPSIEYVCYCWDQDGNLGREQIYTDMLDQMKKISVERNDDDAAIVTDIFTDPDEGYPLIITKAKNDKGKYEITCSCELPGKKETWADFFARTFLTDEQLSDLMSKESLRELYEDVYTTRDFNMAIDGLRRFDTQHKYGIFENEEFLEKLVEIKATVPEYQPKSNEESTGDTKEVEELPVAPVKSTPVSKPAKVEPPTTPVVETSKKFSTPIPAMKRILKEYIAENYGSDFSLPDLPTEELVKWYELAQNGEELPFDSQENEKTPAPPTQPVIPPPPQPVSEPASSTVNPDLAAQIAALRKNRQPKSGV